MFPQSSELKAFFTSALTMTQYSLSPPSHCFPAILSETRAITCIACDLLNPYPLSKRTPLSLAIRSTRSYTSRSNHFPFVSTRQMGPRDDDSFGGLLFFEVTINFRIFPFPGKILSCRHFWSIARESIQATGFPVPDFFAGVQYFPAVTRGINSFPPPYNSTTTYHFLQEYE